MADSKHNDQQSETPAPNSPQQSRESGSKHLVSEGVAAAISADRVTEIQMVKNGNKGSPQASNAVPKRGEFTVSSAISADRITTDIAVSVRAKATTVQPAASECSTSGSDTSAKASED